MNLFICENNIDFVLVSNNKYLWFTLVLYEKILVPEKLRDWIIDNNNNYVFEINVCF